MVPEAPLEQTENGKVARGDGWYVLNARDATWYDRGRRGAVCDFEAGQDWPQLGVNLFVLGPGEPMSMYHWEADQEDFLVLSGEALLIVEEEERPLRQWDFVHTPPRVSHTIVGAGSGPAVILAVGARENQGGEGWGGYPFSEVAMRHDASAERETNRGEEAYARFPRRRETPYREGWLPE
ncbi:MAG TPA: cupin domain-containing protein [Gaiellaceae bacterium]|nr:cupin domain-containing protein [Gaiellaceae bacterium]